MDLNTVWSSVLSFVSGILILVWKGHADEVKRLQILLNRTREEIAREYITKEEVDAHINRIMNRLDVLDAKLDRIIESYRTRGGSQ